MRGGVRRGSEMRADWLSSPTGIFDDVAPELRTARFERLRGARDARTIEGWAVLHTAVSVGRLHPRPPG